MLEGDNYIWLKILEQTHAGKIDVVYIDPPYGTNNKASKETGFRYNDKFVDANDSFKNSKWLDFMEKRLLVARALLKQGGMIFISIDQNHQADAEYLCNTVFETQNKLCNISVVNNLKGRSDDAFFATAHEHLICYTTDKSKAVLGGFPLTEKQASEYKFKDEVSRYKLVGLKKTGKNCYREDRPNMYYPIYYVPERETFSLEKTSDAIEILPEINGRAGRWRWGRDTFLAKKDTELVAKQQKDEWVVYVKMRDLVDGKERVSRPKSVWINPSYDSGNGTDENKDIFGDKVFNNPKPLSYIKDIMRISLPKNGIVLDFFAGSGTTAHAVEELNKEDNGHRQWILVTNNEDQDKDDDDPDTGICRDITKPRIDTVITGIRPDGSQYSDGCDSGYQYFQYNDSALSKGRSVQQNMREFGCFEAVSGFLEINGSDMVFIDDKDVMGVIFENEDTYQIALFKDQTNEAIDALIDKYGRISPDKDIIVYGDEITASQIDRYRTRDFSSMVSLEYLQRR